MNTEKSKSKNGKLPIFGVMLSAECDLCKYKTKLHHVKPSRLNHLNEAKMLCSVCKSKVNDSMFKTH